MHNAIKIVSSGKSERDPVNIAVATALCGDCKCKGPAMGIGCTVIAICVEQIKIVLRIFRFDESEEAKNNICLCKVLIVVFL